MKTLSEVLETFVVRKISLSYDRLHEEKIPFIFISDRIFRKVFTATNSEWIDICVSSYSKVPLRYFTVIIWGASL